MDIGIKKGFQTGFELETSGVAEIRKELQNYYENERFEILKRKVDTNRRELKTVFEELLSNFDTDFDPNFVENEKIRITIETSDQIKNSLKKSLDELKSELKEEIWVEEYFSNKFRDDITNLSYFQEISEEDIKKIKISEDDSLTLDTPIEKINQAIRKNLHKKFLEEFSKLILYMTDEKSKDVQVRVLRTFTSSVYRELKNF